MGKAAYESMPELTASRSVALPSRMSSQVCGRCATKSSGHTPGSAGTRSPSAMGPSPSHDAA